MSSNIEGDNNIKRSKIQIYDGNYNIPRRFYIESTISVEQRNDENGTTDAFSDKQRKVDRFVAQAQTG